MEKRNGLFRFSLIFVGFLVACGNSEDPVTKPKLTTAVQDEPTVASVEIDFATEDQSINAVLANQNEAISTKELDDIMVHWVKSEDKEVFSAWTFWAGAFEKNEGWKAVKNGWVGIFKLHAGEMSVQVSRLEIDSRARNAIVYGKYKWGNQNGDLIAAFQNQKGKWKIRAIDFTNERFGKQIPKLAKQAYRNPKATPA